MNELQTERFALCSLTVYRELCSDAVIRLLIRLMSQQYENVFAAAEDYAQMYALLSNSDSKGDLTGYLYQKVLYSDNLFTRQAAWGAYGSMSAALRQAAARDLSTLWRASAIDAPRLKRCIAGQFADESLNRLVETLPEPESTQR